VAGTRDALRHASVRRYLASTAFAALGLNVLVTVLYKQVFDITGDELDIGLLGLAQFLPAVFLVLVSGWVADRFDRRGSPPSSSSVGCCAPALSPGTPSSGRPPCGRSS
jgi:MFS family permease